MFCSKCGKEIADDAGFCQYCGEKIDKENTSQQNNKMLLEQKNKPSGCFIILIVALIVFIGLMILGSLPEEPIENDTYAQESLARNLCESRIRQNLKNPKSAEFAPRSEINFTRIKNMEYIVSSYYYAQNGFGATIKSHYACSVKLTDKENGIIEDIVFN